MKPLVIYIAIAILVCLQASAYGQTSGAQKQFKPGPSSQKLNVAESVALYLAVGLAKTPSPELPEVSGRVELLMMAPFHMFERKDIESLVVQGIPLSNDLKNVIRSIMRDDPDGFVTATIDHSFWVRYSSDGIVIEIDPEWRDPLLFNQRIKSAAGSLRFRNGEIGIVQGRVFIKNGTEVQCRRQTYAYDTGVWNLKSKP
jgi:hypothetical protein